MAKQPTKAQVRWLEYKLSKAKFPSEVNSLGTQYYFRAEVKHDKWEFCDEKWVEIDLPNMGRFSLLTQRGFFKEDPLAFYLVKV